MEFEGETVSKKNKKMLTPKKKKHMVMHAENVTLLTFLESQRYHH
jgi:hypothetical protein